MRDGFGFDKKKYGALEEPVDRVTSIVHYIAIEHSAEHTVEDFYINVETDYPTWITEAADRLATRWLDDGVIHDIERNVTRHIPADDLYIVRESLRRMDSDDEAVSSAWKRCWKLYWEKIFVLFPKEEIETLLGVLRGRVALHIASGLEYRPVSHSWSIRGDEEPEESRNKLGNMITDLSLNLVMALLSGLDARSISSEVARAAPAESPNWLTKALDQTLSGWVGDGTIEEMRMLAIERAPEWMAEHARKSVKPGTQWWKEAYGDEFVSKASSEYRKPWKFGVVECLDSRYARSLCSAFGWGLEDKYDGEFGWEWKGKYHDEIHENLTIGLEAVAQKSDGLLKDAVERVLQSLPAGPGREALEDAVSGRKGFKKKLDKLHFSEKRRIIDIVLETAPEGALPLISYDEWEYEGRGTASALLVMNVLAKALFAGLNHEAAAREVKRFAHSVFGEPYGRKIGEAADMWVDCRDTNTLHRVLLEYSPQGKIKAFEETSKRTVRPGTNWWEETAGNESDLASLPHGIIPPSFTGSLEYIFDNPTKPSGY